MSTSPESKSESRPDFGTRSAPPGSAHSTPHSHVADRLLDAVDRIGTPICIGLDPVLDRLPNAVRAAHADPSAAIEAFSAGVIEAVVKVAPCVKFQSACYERYGAEGIRALERSTALAAASGLHVILDAKRGDIGISAAHYAASAFRCGTVDWLTVNPYLGSDGLTPFFGDTPIASPSESPPGSGPATSRGAFALVRTSNPSGDELQSLRLADGRTVDEAVAALVDRLGSRSIGRHGYSALGAVVGATRPADAERLRRIMPQAIFLVPGFGAQGGTADDVRACFDDQGRGALVTASRSVIYAFDAESEDWRSAVTSAAVRFGAEIRDALDRH